jgi:hypothetical protein
MAIFHYPASKTKPIKHMEAQQDIPLSLYVFVPSRLRAFVPSRLRVPPAF